MHASDYHESLKDGATVLLPEVPDTPWEPGLASAMRVRKLATFEEALMPDLMMTCSAVSHQASDTHAATCPAGDAAGWPDGCALDGRPVAADVAATVAPPVGRTRAWPWP